MIYLDHAASTVPFAEVGELYKTSVSLFGNPSSVHSFGRDARAALDETKLVLSSEFEAKTEEIIFTSGATEAMHLAIIGHYLSRRSRNESGRGVVYTSPLVHSCVWSALHFLEKNFSVTIKLLPITDKGFLDLAAMGEDLFNSDLIVTEFGNSELGLLQPVAKLGKMINKWHSENKDAPKPAFVVDAAAAIVTEKITLDYQVCDFITVSAEKFGGLKGSGVLLRRVNVGLNSIIGGSHELGYRGGTENVTGALALGTALKLHSEQRSVNREQFLGFQQYLRTWFENNYPDIKITTPIENTLPHVFHFILPTSQAALFVAQADLAGLAISAGSACSSGTTTASKVLLHLDLSEIEAERGIRISFGRTTTQAEIDEAFKIMASLLKK